jgi:hypothetical protein
MSRDSALIALASVVMSETTVVSQFSEADRTRWGTGGTGSDSPGTTIPPIAAGPVDGLSAVLPAASPAAEMPGFGLDTAAPPHFQVTRGWPPCEPPPVVALPRAHHLHVARPPVRVYENAAREAQRIKGRPKKRFTLSRFTLCPRSGELGDGSPKPAIRGAILSAPASASGSHATATRGGAAEDPGESNRSHGRSRHHMVLVRRHKNWHPPGATSDLSKCPSSHLPSSPPGPCGGLPGE